MARAKLEGRNTGGDKLAGALEGSSTTTAAVALPAAGHAWRGDDVS